MSGTLPPLPTVVTKDGLQPVPPATIHDELLAAVAAEEPGYTANLPGSLIEDISSTDVGAIVLIDQARVETVNSLTPYGANAFILNQLGVGIYGVPPSPDSLTTAFVVFSGPPGFVVAQGFVVSDGSHQYTVSDGGIIQTGGDSLSLFVTAIDSGSWAVPANTITQLVTSVPSTIILTVTNPQDGTPAGPSETEETYRSRVLTAGLAASQGMTRYLKTLLANVPGVQPRLISVRQITGGRWEVICGGGDPYEVADAIFSALFDVSTLTGSVLTVSNITRANPGVVTTALNHGYTTGQAIVINNATGMTAVNGVTYTATVLSETTFSIGVDTSGFSTYTGNGVVTPNFRNITVAINDYPDVYVIPYVNPPQQTVAMTVTWNTTSLNFVSAAAVAQLAQPALVTYVNSIPVGAPMNLFELQTVFQQAVSPILSPILLTRMVFAVSINGIGAAPEAGTGIIAGDPESYFLTNTTEIVVSQG